MRDENPQTQDRDLAAPEEDYGIFILCRSRNLEDLTPGWLHFEILTPMPLQMKSGVLIDYRLRLYGIPLHWQSEICVWEPPHRFVDRQIPGTLSSLDTRTHVR